MKIDKPDLTIIVPVYNEEQILQKTSKELAEYCLARDWKVIFVNDGSRDSSGKILNSLSGNPHVKILHHKVNRGYGGAIKTGMKNTETSYLVTIDADGQHSLKDIDRLFEIALQNDADLVVGNRGAKGNVNVYRAVGKQLIRSFVRILMRLPIHDLNSGFKLYRAELAKRYMKICPDTMSFSEIITLIFVNQRQLVLEYDISIKPREKGKSTIGIFTAFDAFMEILNIAILFNPLRIFIPVSMSFILGGGIWGIIIYSINKLGVSVGAMLAIVTGIIFFVLGLLANQISELRMEQIQE